LPAIAGVFKLTVLAPAIISIFGGNMNLGLRLRFGIYNLGMDLKDLGERLYIKKIRGVPVFRKISDRIRDFGLRLVSMA